MKRKSVFLFLMLLTVCSAATTWASQATWDMSYIKNTMTSSDVDIPYEDTVTINSVVYCEGIVKFKNKQEVNGVEQEGWAYGYYAVKLQGDEDECADITTSTNKRPAIVYLHHYQPRVEDAKY